MTVPVRDMACVVDIIFWIVEFEGSSELESRSTGLK